MPFGYVLRNHQYLRYRLATLTRDGALRLLVLGCSEHQVYPMLLGGVSGLFLVPSTTISLYTEPSTVRYTLMPLGIDGFALMLAVFAFSMFGLYELQLPARWRDAMSVTTHRLRGGHVASVFAMGGLSALIVSPCVAAPLAGALIYLSQTRDVVLGGSALFSLAAGMSLPLLIVGCPG